MKKKSQECTSYIIDTYKSVSSGKYLPGAIVFKGKKKMETLQWKDMEFPSQEDADQFVRSHFVARGLSELRNEGELFKYRPTLTFATA